ncbi:hypothetical protein SAMN05444172_9345 [Burkholderia sp. GAS332]|nr:hypothetical protein SAMN05444172_9345 [Burkholderia sp. GAS332]
MSSFRVRVGNFEIVGTTGEADGYQPAKKSEAESFDVIDKRTEGGKEYLFRDPSFETAWFFCIRRLAIVAVPRPH